MFTGGYLAAGAQLVIIHGFLGGGETVTVIDGPWCVEAAGIYVAGVQQAGVYVAGKNAAGTYVAGQQEALAGCE